MLKSSNDALYPCVEFLKFLHFKLGLVIDTGTTISTVENMLDDVFSKNGYY